MNLVALYKTWDGGEFVDASLASIYHHVTAIVMVHSEVSWLGERGNTVRAAALRWCERNDVETKVHHVDIETTSQEQQYQAGLDYIASKRIQFDAIMVVDADEVWEAPCIENAIRQMTDRPLPAYLCRMHTYLKTPFYRVNPPYGNPVAFLRDPQRLTQSPRGCRGRAHLLSDVWMHHYTYVRRTREDVERKILQSCRADGGESVVPGWMENVYDHLPQGTDLHAFTRHTRVWKGIEKIWYSDLPPTMRDAELLPLWLPDGLQHRTDENDRRWTMLMHGEQNALFRLAKGRTQAVDLGTYRMLSAVILGLACERVHTFDCYGDFPGDPGEYDVIVGHSLAHSREVAARFGNITCDQSDTAEAGRRWRGRPVDVLFVDADHSEAGTIANVEAWMPHMRTGGLIILHDDNDAHPGVQSAIRQMRSDARFRFFDPGEYSGSIAVCEVTR